MKLRVLRHSTSKGQLFRLILGAVAGLSCAAATVFAAVFVPDGGSLDAGSAVPAGLVAAAFLCWTLGWPLGPLFTGGADETLRPEYFALLPLSRRRLAAGLLVAAAVGVPGVVTLIAFTALPVLAARLGFGPFVVALPALALQFAFAVVLGRVVIGGLGAVLRSRRGRDLGALLTILLITFGWTLVFPLQSVIGQLATGGAPAFAALARALPSGWGVAAVEAAYRGDWLLAAAALAGLGALTGVLFLAWSALLTRRMTGRAWRGAARRDTRGRSTRWPGPLGTPSGAVLVKEMITWGRDSGRTLLLLIPVMVALANVVPRWLFEDDPVVNPYAGLLVATVACFTAGNCIALDGGAVWQTLVTPGASRPDVRGRQYAWLLVMSPVAVAMTAGFTAGAGDRLADAWPWALAALPAVLGAGSGLVLLQAVYVPYSAGDPRVASPLANNAKPTVVTFGVWVAVIPALALAAAPGVALAFAGQSLDRPALAWAGVPAGVVSGVLLAWWLGRIAYRRLSVRGPEVLAVAYRGHG
jgi:ABC-2 type transport system permease protein